MLSIPSFHLSTYAFINPFKSIHPMSTHPPFPMCPSTSPFIQQPPMHQSLTHPPTYSFTHLSKFIHLVPVHLNPLPYPPIHPLPPPSIHPLIYLSTPHLPPHPSIHSLIHPLPLTHPSTHPLLTHPLILPFHPSSTPTVKRAPLKVHLYSEPTSHICFNYYHSCIRCN